MHTEYCSRSIVLTSLFSFAQGWGKTSSNLNSDFSKVLKQAKMPVVDYQTCAAGNANLSYAKVNDETMLCAGYGGSSVISGCHGDSGGPFVCRERRLWVLRGAVSWGDHRCRAGSTFSVFTRISTFVDWISATKIKPEHVSGKINRIFIIPSVSIKINLIENVKVLIQQSVTDTKN